MSNACGTVTVQRDRRQAILPGILVLAFALLCSPVLAQENPLQKVGRQTRKAASTSEEKEDAARKSEPRKKRSARQSKEKASAEDSAEGGESKGEEPREGTLKDRAQQLINKPWHQPDEELIQMFEEQADRKPFMVLSGLVTLVCLVLLIYGWPLFRGLFVPSLTGIGFLLGAEVGFLGAVEAGIGFPLVAVFAVLTAIALAVGFFWLGIRFDRLACVVMVASIGIGNALLLLLMGSQREAGLLVLLTALVAIASFRFLRFVVILTTTTFSAPWLVLTVLSLLYATDIEFLINAVRWVAQARWHIYMIMACTAFVGVDIQYVLGPPPIGKDTGKEAAAMADMEIRR